MKRIKVIVIKVFTTNRSNRLFHFEKTLGHPTLNARFPHRSTCELRNCLLAYESNAYAETTTTNAVKFVYDPRPNRTAVRPRQGSCRSIVINRVCGRADFAAVIIRFLFHPKPARQSTFTNNVIEFDFSGVRVKGGIARPSDGGLSSGGSAA